MKLDNIRLLVTNFDECLYFYQEILGFPLTWGETGGNYASFDVGEGSVLALFKKEMMSEALGSENLLAKKASQDSFACIFRVIDLKDTVQAIKDRGGFFISEIEDKPLWGIRTAHLRDPDGNLLEIVSALPREEWAESLVEEDCRYE